MNRIQQLIKELCPNGVEWKTLGEVCEIKRGIRVVKSQLKEIGKYPVFQNCLTPLGYYDNFNRESGTYLISAGAAGDVGFCNTEFWSADDCLCFLNLSGLIDKYLYYVLKVKQSILYSNVRKASIPRLSKDIVEKISIPVPPLPIQEEIVSILDKFVEQQEQLEKLIELRKKQYEYYREELLRPKEGWESLKIGDLLEFKNGLNASKDQFGHGDPIVNYVNVYKKRTILSQDLKGLVQLNKDTRSRYDVKRGDVFFTRTSETLEEIGYASVLLEDIPNGVFSGFVLRGRPINNKLYPEYCAYCFSTSNIRMQIKALSTITTRALTNGKSLSKVKICLPTYKEQKKIAESLNNFESSISTLTAALELSKKQYEYYREELLRF